jgi:hypothetical protein
MAADAEIELSPRLAGRSRVGVGRKSIVLKSRERRRKEILTDTQGNAQPGKIEESNLSELDPALVVILRRLPKLWAEWEVDEKANFIKAFEALLDFVYPSKTKRPPPLEHDNGQIEQGNQVIISH